MTLEEYWNFDITTFANQDIPTLVEKVLEETNISHVTYVGYS